MSNDIERAAQAARQYLLSVETVIEPEAITRAVIEAVLLDTSEEAMEVATKAALQAFCQPTIAVAWSELQPAAKMKWKAITRAALRAAGLAMLGRK